MMDFAFLFDYNSALYHLFYIRQDTSIEPTHPELTENTFGHAECSLAGGLVTSGWVQKPIMMRIRPGHFDNQHIWAPSILKVGPTYYMFYTGVDTISVSTSATGHQRMGVAWSTNLEDTSWTRTEKPIFGNYAVPWAISDSTKGDAFQFRDPFVMEDPESTGHYLMYYVTKPKAHPGAYVVGLAKSTGDLTKWVDYGRMNATDSINVGGDTVEESPHIFWSHRRWRLFYTANAGSHGIQYVEHDSTADTLAAPTDTSGVGFSHWQSRQRLVYYVGSTDSVNVSGWLATEYLAVPRNEYLAAYISSAIAIGELSWSGINFTVGAPTTASVADLWRPHSSGVALGVVNYRSTAPSVLLRLELPTRLRATVEVFDVGGRRLGQILSRDLPAGVTTLTWESRHGQGAVHASGLYFIRLATPRGDAVTRVPVLF